MHAHNSAAIGPKIGPIPKMDRSQRIYNMMKPLVNYRMEQATSAFFGIPEESVERSGPCVVALLILLAC
jgi:hypothetical protein